MNSNTKRVLLFVPCLVDQLYPEVGIASANILTHFGYEVSYASEVVCCGQPAFNAGHNPESIKVASQCLKSLAAAKDCGAIVCPSGSCTAMVRNFYPELFKGHALQAELDDVRAKLFELAEFLVKQGHSESPDALQLQGQRIGFHNSCHSLRELRLATEGKQALTNLGGCDVVEPAGEHSCCGFGGLFCVKFEELSGGMAKSRLERFADAGVSRIASNDPGCIMHLQNEAKHHQIETELQHIAIPIAKALGLSIETLT